MEHFTTITQWRILKYFWRRQRVFTLEDLLAEKIIHFPALGRLTLRMMEWRGQVLSRCVKANEIEYFATTNSKEEWRHIWSPRPFIEAFFGDRSSNMRGVNRYEHAESMAALNRILEDYRNRTAEERTEEQMGIEL